MKNSITTYEGNPILDHFTAATHSSNEPVISAIYYDRLEESVVILEDISKIELIEERTTRMLQLRLVKDIILVLGNHSGVEKLQEYNLLNLID